MKIINIFIITALSVFFLPSRVLADGGDVLYLYSASSMTPTTCSLDDLDKITFSGSDIQFHTVDGTRKVAFSDFVLLTFSEIEHPFVSGIDIISTSKEVSVLYEEGSGSLLVKSDLMLDGVYIYDMQGRTVAQAVSPSSSFNITFGTAHAGIYILKIVCGDKSIVKKIAL